MAAPSAVPEHPAALGRDGGAREAEAAVAGLDAARRVAPAGREQGRGSVPKRGEDLRRVCPSN